MTTPEDCADRSQDGQPAAVPAGSDGPPARDQADVTHRSEGGERSGADAPTPELAALVEAVLLVADEPVPAVTLAQVVERGSDEVHDALSQLARAYDEQGRGFELREVGGGWRYTTRGDCAPWVERFLRNGQQARLTQAALETLAVVAYRQPVTRARVSAVRGVNVDGVVRTLVSRGLLAEAGHDADTGGMLYVTTSLLLQKLGLRSLDDLPSLAPLLPELVDVEEGSTST